MNTENTYDQNMKEQVYDVGVVKTGAREELKFELTKENSDLPEKILVKEDLLFQCITNLIRKSNFLKLYIKLTEDQISDEEFENEIEENPHEYVIDLKPIDSGLHFQLLVEILQKFPKKNISLDEFAEIFSISPSSIQESFLKEIE